MVLILRWSYFRGGLIARFYCIDIVPDVPDTSGESKNNIGPPSSGPKNSEINLSFMVVGHTRCAVEGCFGLIKSVTSILIVNVYHK